MIRRLLPMKMFVILVSVLSFTFAGVGEAAPGLCTGAVCADGITPLAAGSATQ